MLTEQKHYGLAAVARFWMGTVLSGTSSWLILCNILLTSMGMVAALAGGGTVIWEGFWPVMAVTGPASLSLTAGCLLGVISSIVEVLYWRGDLDLHNASFWVRVTVLSIMGFDILSTVWALTNGVFYEPDNPIPSLTRVAMALAVTLFAFSVGAEQWMVLGVRLVANNWTEAFITMKLMPDKRGKNKGGGGGFQPPMPTNIQMSSQHSQPRHDRPTDAEREAQSQRDRQEAARRRAEMSNQQQHMKGGRR